MGGRLTRGILLAMPAVVLAGVVVGQLLRIQPFSGTPAALLAVDIGLVAFNLAFFIRTLRKRQLGAFIKYLWRHPVWKWSVWFLLWATVSLLINAIRYTAHQDLVAASYLGRLALVFGWLWFSAYYSRELGRRYLTYFTAAGVALLVLGFLQFIFFYDFREMVRYGWDPHYGRLLSTFFDPNYFGVFLVLLMVYALARGIAVAGRARLIWLALFGASWAALFLAYSRSAWIAGLLAVPGFFWRYSRRGSLILLVAFLAVLLLPNRLSQRFADSGATLNQKNYAGGNYQCNDANARCDVSGSQRVLTIHEGLRLFGHHPVIGVGYNAYGTALVKEGIEPDTRLQSKAAQGNDSSLLTVAATTGTIGLLIFLGFFLAIFRRLLRVSAKSGPYQPLAHALLWFTFAWILASFLNNSLLYILILVPYAGLLAAVSESTIRRRG